MKTKLLFFSVFSICRLLFAGELPPTLESLRVLLILDEQGNGIEEGVKTDGENIRATLSHIFQNSDFPRLRQKKVKIDQIGGAAPVTWKEISDYFEKAPVSKEESLLIYYSGHGGYRTDVAMGQTLKFSGGDEVPRSALVALAEKTESPLRIVITDACSNLADVDPGIKYVASYEGMVEREKQENLHETLFFRHRGTTNFNSSRFNQKSWTLELGSVMTLVIKATLEKPDIDTIDSDKDGVVTWEELFLNIQADTNLTFKKIRAKTRYAPDDPRLIEMFRAKGQLPQLYSASSLTADQVDSFYVWPEVERDGRKGIAIYSRWNLSGHKGEKIRLVTQFADARNQILEERISGEVEIPIEKYRHVPQEPLFIAYDQVPKTSIKGATRVNLVLVNSATGQTVLKSFRVAIE